MEILKSFTWGQFFWIAVVMTLVYYGFVWGLLYAYNWYGRKKRLMGMPDEKAADKAVIAAVKETKLPVWSGSGKRHRPGEGAVETVGPGTRALVVAAGQGSSTIPAPGDRGVGDVVSVAGERNRVDLASVGNGQGNGGAGSVVESGAREGADRPELFNATERVIELLKTVLAKGREEGPGQEQSVVEEVLLADVKGVLDQFHYLKGTPYQAAINSFLMRSRGNSLR